MRKWQSTVMGIMGVSGVLMSSHAALAHFENTNAETAIQSVVHNCSAPIRPQDEQNDIRWRAFLNEVETFRRCVNDKMEWHQAAAAAHQQNASEVVQVWNNFVRLSLNAPEDFPWPGPAVNDGYDQPSAELFAETEEAE